MVHFYLCLPSQVGVTTALLTTIIGVITINQTWGEEWTVIPISLQVSLKQITTQRYTLTLYAVTLEYYNLRQ